MSLSAPVSVVISSFQEGAALAETVSSVSRANPVPREIVIVDDGSTDGSTERAWPLRVTVVRQQHIGIAAARNRGACEATQPTLVFLDAHCTVDDLWLEPILHALTEDPDALVGPAVRDADHPRYVGCGAQIVDTLFTYRWCQVATTERGAVDVGLVPGGCLAVRRDRFLRSGGFGPFTGFGIEDVELGLRWWRAGYPLLGAPGSVVTHRFRARPRQRPDHQAWLQNILRTALLHLSGEQLRACVTACARFWYFSTAIATVLSEPWMATHRRMSDTEVRTVAAYFDQWAPRAFPPPPIAGSPSSARRESTGFRRR